MSTPPDLGPLPEPVARMSPDGKSLIREATYVYGVKSGDELFSRVNGFTVTLHTSDQTRDFGQRCYMLGVAAASQWRPIETAPKDGTVILAFRALPCGPEMSSVAWKHSEHAFGNSGWHYPEWNGPTHWMPLPSAPTKEGG